MIIFIFIIVSQPRFASDNTMSQYGQLLQNFKTNSLEVNECIFTMMYHVAGDCEKPDTLLRLPILKVFTELWNHDYPLSEVCTQTTFFISHYFDNSLAQISVTLMISWHRFDFKIL